MKGYLKGSKGINISERKLRLILPRIAPIGHFSRTASSQERRNPAICDRVQENRA